jgi:hypothetical protein
MVVPIHLKGIRDLGNLETPSPDAHFFKPPRGDTEEILFPGDDQFEYGNSYYIKEYDDGTDIKLDTIQQDLNYNTEAGSEVEIEGDSQDDTFTSSVKPSKNIDKNIVQDQFLDKGINLPQYLLILVCIGVGLLLWIFAWIGWSCRKCCHAKKERDTLKIKQGILGTRDISHRLQSDPLPIPAAITEGFKHPLGHPAETVGTLPSRFVSSNPQKTTSQEHLVTEKSSSRDWPLPQGSRHESYGSSYPAPESDGYSSKHTAADTVRQAGEKKSRDRQTRTGYGHRRDLKNQKSQKSRKNQKVESPEPESGFGESDNDVNKLLKYHQSLQQQSGNGGSTHADALMFLAKDTTLNLSNKPSRDTISIDMPPLVNKLSPEDSRNIEINEMIKNANNTIHFDATEAVEDITIMPLKNKTVSLGRPVFPGNVTVGDPPAYSVTKRQKKEKKERKPSPLANWAAVANANDVECSRNVHEQQNDYNHYQHHQREIEINEIQKMKKYQKRKQTTNISDKAMKDQGRKINAIKKRIDDIEAAAAMSDSDMNLSELSD